MATFLYFSDTIFSQLVNSGQIVNDGYLINTDGYITYIDGYIIDELGNYIVVPANNVVQLDSYLIGQIGYIIVPDGSMIDADGYINGIPLPAKIMFIY